MSQNKHYHWVTAAAHLTQGHLLLATTPTQIDCHCDTMDIIGLICAVYSTN